jgi:Type II secretion system (T2SS), protein G
MRRNVFILAFVLFISTPARADLSQKVARKVIQTMAGWSLPSDSVRIQSVGSNSADVAEVSAEIQMVFRLRLLDGHWQLSEIRTGQDRWERLGVLARAANVELPAGECDAPSQLLPDTKLTTRRARCLIATLFGVGLPSDEVRIKEVSPFGLSLGSESAALVVALVQVNFRMARDSSGWHVADFKSGAREWVNVTGVPAAVDQIKRSAATDELSTIAKALDTFRRERGYFVVSDRESVLIDHLSPKYLPRVIREDPWHRPYAYEGQQDRYSLRSLGPDGKANTADDIIVSSP